MSHYKFSEADPVQGICDRCGFMFNLSALKREWTGLLVCHGPNSNHCFEPRQSQDYVRGIPDHQSVKNPRPEAQDVFITSYLMRETNQPYLREAQGAIVRE